MVLHRRVAGFVPTVLALLMVTPLSLVYGQAPRSYENTIGGPRIIEEGQPEVLIHPLVEDVGRSREALERAGGKGRPFGGGGASPNLTYHGGTGGIGVETQPMVYLVLWGSQWTNNDPSGEEVILTSFFSEVGGSPWANSVTQYCQGVSSGTVVCPVGATLAGNPSNILGGVYYDTGSAAPSHPKQSQLAAEAVKAAQYFHNDSPDTKDNNNRVQYVIATAKGNSSSGFGTQYCAWHSKTSSSSTGNIAYTNLPYITDAGGSCGANFNGLGPKAGITIVAGHELTETMTDQFPSTGWTDSGGAENADKCVWISSGQGAATNITLNGEQFAVQSLWSNAFNNGAGGCVTSY
jgi:hypothetical protein